MASTAALCERIGVTRLANLTGLDRIGYPVVAAIRPMSRNLSVSMGKGETLSGAEMSALMEAAELYFSERPDPQPTVACYRDMRPGEALNPELFAQGPGSNLAETPLAWVKGQFLTSGDSVLVPWMAISMDFTEEAVRLPRPIHSSGTGLAAETVRSSAILHGLLEVIERESHARWNELGNSDRLRTLVDAKAIEDDGTAALLARIDAAGLHVFIWDLTARDGLPCYMVEIVDFAANATTPFAQGVAAHLRPGTAVHKALAEALQVRLTYISGSRDDLNWGEYEGRFNDVVESRRSLADAVLGQRPVVTVNDVPSDPDDAISRILTGLGGEADNALVVDLSPLDAGLAVAKVMIPTLPDTPESNHYHLKRRGGGA